MEPTDGITLMQDVHAVHPRLPVLIMTAHGTIETAVLAVQRGAFDYLTKPFVRDELRTKILRALSERRWARDRDRLRTVGETLASSGIMERILDAVAQAAVETTEAECSVVSVPEKGQLTPMASAGSPPPAWEPLQTAAAAAVEKSPPTTMAGGEGRVMLASPLFVGGGPAGAVVILAPARVEPTDDDLELLALFSSQAAIAIKNTHELSRLRSGALAALGRMATQVAHELKNPLAGLRLYARHLEQRLDAVGDGDSAGLARKITSTVDHLAAVVSEITAYGRPPELHRAPVALHALLDECVSFAQARITTADIEIFRVYDPSAPAQAMLDARELRKAFLNLVLNGLESLAPGGRLTVTTAWAADTKALTVTIEDTGGGMPDETLSRIFDLFFTTKPQGTGLGMAIARSVIDLHGGELAVHSVLGQGTRVSARLPFEAAPGQAEDKAT